MSTKTTLLTIICIVFLAMSFNNAVAQQSKSATGKLFLHIPGTETPVSGLEVRSGIAGPDQLTAPTRSANRSFNGTANNLTTSDKNKWGSANIPLLRELPAAYGSSDRNNALGGTNRPSARKISNLIVDEPETIFNGRGLSTFVYIWGQFLDHEITLTPTGTTESVPIILPADDTIFTENIPFTRSSVFPGTGNGTTRQQFNVNTAWIDGSVVYGSDQTRANWLRTFSKGKMKTSAGNLLPWNTVTGQKSAAIDPNAPDMANDGGHTIKTFVAGDVRAAEHPDLTSLHTLFVREHNRICDKLVKSGMTNDEQIYQLARKKVGALIQAVTYNEFLPALGINIHPLSGYKPNARPDLTNVFATAGYRLGHTMVADEVLLFDNDCQPLDPESLELVDIFWNPSVIEQYNLEPFIKGSAAHTQYETNIKINSVLRNFLFGSPNSPVRFGIDLASLNIQRGRDHGLPDYNTIRKFYTGSGATTFSNISSDPTLAANLQSLYGNVNNVDAWTGVLAEDLVGGTSVGKTVQAILRVQFENLRDGDFYFFEWDPFLPTEDRNEARNSHLTDIIKRNTKVTNLQSNPFFVQGCPGFTTTPAVAVPSTSVFENTNHSLKIYPNPVSDVMNINLGTTGQSGTIRVFTAQGILMKTIITGANEKNIRINTSGFSKGIYIINVITGKQKQSFKFVKL
jgi:peroxidase